MIPFEYPTPMLTEHGIEFFKEMRSFGNPVTDHNHSAIEFVFIKRGIFDVGVNKKRIRALPGDLVLCHSQSIHSIEPQGEEAGVYYVLKFSSSFLFTMFQKNSIPYVLPFLKAHGDDIVYFPSDTMPAEMRRVWETMIREYEANSPTCFAMLRLLACEFLLLCSRMLEQTRKADAQMANGDAATPELSDRAVKLITDNVNYINGHFHLPLTASECAAQAHLSYGHYAKLFRSVMGKSFKEYLTSLRMTKAYNMLLSSDLPVSEVALACGYENFSYFIAEFKKVYHITPSQLRKQTQGQ